MCISICVPHVNKNRFVRVVVRYCPFKKSSLIVVIEIPWLLLRHPESVKMPVTMKRVPDVQVYLLKNFYMEGISL